MGDVEKSRAKCWSGGPAPDERQRRDRDHDRGQELEVGCPVCWREWNANYLRVMLATRPSRGPEADMVCPRAPRESQLLTPGSDIPNGRTDAAGQTIITEGQRQGPLCGWHFRSSVRGGYAEGLIHCGGAGCIRRLLAGR